MGCSASRDLEAQTVADNLYSDDIEHRTLALASVYHLDREAMTEHSKQIVMSLFWDTFQVRSNATKACKLLSKQDLNMHVPMMIEWLAANPTFEEGADVGREIDLEMNKQKRPGVFFVLKLMDPADLERYMPSIVKTLEEGEKEKHFPDT